MPRYACGTPQTNYAELFYVADHMDDADAVREFKKFLEEQWPEHGPAVSATDDDFENYHIVYRVADDFPLDSDAINSSDETDAVGFVLQRGGDQPY